MRPVLVRKIRARLLASAMILCALMISAPLAAFILSCQPSDEGSSDRAVAAAYVTHDPIVIVGNFNFTNYSGVFRGNGTQDDPYIIENLSIDASGSANAISIRDSDAHFRIQGCLLANAKENGIFLSNVTNGSLDGNFCTGNDFYGIALLGCSNNTIVNNTCTSSLYGIDLCRSDRNAISNNSCSGNSYYGIALVTSSGNEIWNNTCHYDQIGIGLQFSHGNVVSDNNCSGGQYGVSISHSDNNTVAGNVCSLDQYGIQLHSSDNSTLSNNTCLSDAITGLSVDSSQNNAFSNNTLLGNLYGLEFKRSQYNFNYNPDYLFYRINDTYYAKNNGTGAVSSNNDSRVLIQSVINSLNSNPTRFFFDGSEYVINTSGAYNPQYYPGVVWEIGIRVNKQVSFIGNGTIFKAAPNLPNPFAVFYIDHVDFVEMRGLHIDCNQAAQGIDRWVMGVMTHTSDYLLIEYCEFENFAGYGIFIDVSSDFPTVRYNYVHDNFFNSLSDYSHGIALHNNGEEGLVIGNRVDRINYGKYAIFIDSVDKVRVVGNTVGEANGWGIVVSDQCNNTLIIGNEVTRRGNSYRTIAVANSYSTQVIDNLVHGKASINEANGGIYVNNRSRTTIVRNNHLDDATIIDNANDSSIFSNDGYMVEDMGLAFTVYKVGADYYAENATGVLTYTNPNFTALMASVIADSPSASKIVFEEANYTIESSGLKDFSGLYYGIFVNKSLRLEGQGAKFEMADAVDKNYTLIYVNGTIDFNVLGIAFDVNSDGQSSNATVWLTSGIQFNGSIRPRVQRCEFYDFTSCAYKVNSTAKLPTLKEHDIIEDRTFSRNPVYGILLASSDCDNNTFSGNNCSGSTSYGLKISYNSTGNLIWNNTFRHCNLTGDSYNPAISQAYDGYSGNRWNTSGAPHGYGNYWSDWKGRDYDTDGIQDAPYNLTGAAHQEDFYPLATPPTPEFNFIPEFTVPSLIGNIGLNGWYVSSVSIPWLQSNIQIDYGIYFLFYRIDGGPVLAYNTLIPVGGSGNHTVEFLILDVAENFEVIASVNFKIDVMSPLIDVTVEGEVGTNGWYRSNATVFINVTDDASGVNLTRYRINLGPWHDEIWQNGSISLVFSDGIYDIQYSSVDNASNEGQPKNIKVRIDTGAPTVMITSPSGVLDYAVVSLTWNGGDALSGVAYYMITVDDGDTMVADNSTYSISLNMADGNHTIVVKAVDYAGNSAQSEVHFEINLEVLPPDESGNYITIIAMLVIVSVGIAALYARSVRQKRLQGKQGE